MTTLAALLAQLVHVALVAAAAPIMVGVAHWIEARLAGRQGQSVWQPWRDLRRLLRKQAVQAESASEVTRLAVLVAAVAAAVAACLVPSFSLGMIVAPFTDLLSVVALLALARCSLALAALDAGSATAGMAASRTMLLACLSEPALLIVVFGLGLPAGSVTVDLVAAAQLESGGGWPTYIVIALGATLLVALVDTLHHAPLAQDLSGTDLAAAQLAEAFRRLVWFNLIGAIFLPFGLAHAGAGPLGWLVGVAAWSARTLAFTVALAMLHVVIGRIRLPRAARMLGVAIALALLALAFLFADMGSA